MKTWIMIGAIVTWNPPADIVFKRSQLEMTKDQCIAYRALILLEWQRAGIRGVVSCIQKPPPRRADYAEAGRRRDY